MRAVNRRALVAGLYLRGVTDPTEIAAKLRMPLGSERVVLNDLKVIQRQYSQITASDADAMRNLMAAKLDAVEAASWQAWEESRSRRVVKEKRKAISSPPSDGTPQSPPSSHQDDASPMGQLPTRSIQMMGDSSEQESFPDMEPESDATPEVLLPLVEQEVTSESLAGNPAYLASVRDCIAQRRQMFNLDVPGPEEDHAASSITNNVHITIEQFNALSVSERLRLVRSGSVNLDEPIGQPAGVPIGNSNHHVPHPIPHSAGHDTGRVLPGEQASTEPGEAPAP